MEIKSKSTTIADPPIKPKSQARVRRKYPKGNIINTELKPCNNGRLLYQTVGIKLVPQISSLKMIGRQRNQMPQKMIDCWFKPEPHNYCNNNTSYDHHPKRLYVNIN